MTQTRYLAFVALLGVVLLGVMSYDRGLVPAMRERFMPDSVLYSGNLNTAILERGDWAGFALRGKKFHDSVYGCRWSLPLAVVQWAYSATANEDMRMVAWSDATAVWKNFVAAGTCVETRPVWYTVEDIRPTRGTFLQSYSPGLQHTVPGIATIRIDGSGEPLFIGVHIPLAGSS